VNQAQISKMRFRALEYCHFDRSGMVFLWHPLSQTLLSPVSAVKLEISR